MSISRVMDPDCPACGCNQSELIRTGTRWGQAVETRQCGHCGRNFTHLVPRKIEPKKKRKP